MERNELEITISKVHTLGLNGHNRNNVVKPRFDSTLM